MMDTTEMMKMLRRIMAVNSIMMDNVTRIKHVGKEDEIREELEYDLLNEVETLYDRVITLREAMRES